MLCHQRLNGASTTALLGSHPLSHDGTIRLIDYFALGLTHALLAIALVRLARRRDLDVEQARAPAEEVQPAETRREARERRRNRA